MRHNWYDPRANNDVGRMAYEFRRCHNCGKQQTEVKEYAWQRLVSRRWEPLVGRCKGSKGSRQQSTKGAVPK